MNYDPELMSFNVHDRTYLEEQHDVIYSKVAEVVLAQNERFFKEIERHDRRIAETEDNIADHECRIRKLEKKMMIKKLAIWMGIIILIGSTITLTLIY